MIRFNEVCFSFPEKEILQNCSFSLTQGERVALLGSSGAGKTTFLRLCAGLLVPQKGHIERDGRIVMQFQEPRLLPWLTVEENIRLVLSDGDDQELPEILLDAMGLADWKNHSPEDLSGGMQQRASLTRTLAYGGDVFLLDEPLNAQDAERKETVIDLINEYTEGSSLLLVTHDPEEAARLHCRILPWESL